MSRAPLSRRALVAGTVGAGLIGAISPLKYARAAEFVFKLGTDADKAQVQVQNRVAQALPKLPEEVKRIGVTTLKSSPNLTMVVHLFSPEKRYDEVYVRNYATLQVRDILARLPGVGQVQLFGSGDYAMRVWLDPDKLAARSLTATDVVGAIREQNVQVAIAITPHHPAYWAGVANAPYGRTLATVEAEVGRIAAANGAALVGSFDPAKAGCRESS